ncbi:MAG: hypothetical protein ABIU95_06360 [Burkholderiales bacterium]
MADESGSSGVTPQYVAAVLVVQGYVVAPEAAQAIAAALAAQVAADGPAYARLAFEAEPAGFFASLQHGRAR